jgi:hypothetical protein
LALIITPNHLLRLLLRLENATTIMTGSQSPLVRLSEAIGVARLVNSMVSVIWRLASNEPSSHRTLVALGAMPILALTSAVCAHLQWQQKTGVGGQVEQLGNDPAEAQRDADAVLAVLARNVTLVPLLPWQLLKAAPTKPRR